MKLGAVAAWPLRRKIGLVLFAVGLLIVLGGLWVAVTAVLARGQLQSARREIDQLRTQLAQGDLVAARSTVVDITRHAHRAHELTTGPAWATLAAVPAGGEPFETTRAVAAQVDRLGEHVLPGLVAAARELDPATIRAPDGRIRLSRIAAIAPTLKAANTTVDAATDTLRHQPAHTWLSPVDSARRALITQLTGLGRTIRSADLAATIAPQMLGEDGTRRYFVAFQNEAEARGTGGIPGAFAIMAVTHGRISFERFEPDNFLGTEPTHLEFGHDYDSLLSGARSTSLYVNSNITPQFSYAARIWIAMWRARTGERLDGALALDPAVVSDLLRVTGPATLPDNTLVDAHNVVSLTQQKVYALFPRLRQNDARKRYLLQLAKAVSEKIVAGGNDTASLLKAAGQAAGERRLLVYSINPATERALQQTSLGGDIPVTRRPYVGLSVVNVAGNKLDYYLHRQLTWQRSGCGAQREVTVTARLTNAAPATGLSHYVTERNDFPGHRTSPGDNRLAVYYYATAGARLDSLDIDGRSAPPSSGTLAGHPVFIADVEMPRGQTRDVVFHLTEPAAGGTPLVLRQPLVNPLEVTLHDTRCH